MILHPRVSLRFGLVPLLVSGMALAQAPEPKPDIAKEVEILADLLTLLNTPITTASKRSERAIEAPSVVSVVTRDQIQAYGWTSINDALYSLPGFGPSQDYDRRTVSSRGLFEGWNNNHILLLVDGIPYNDNLYGSAYTWEITPAFLIKTLEVVRGPGSALYGSNSTNSATQVKTISASDLPGGGEAQMRYGGHGERIWDFAVGHTGDLISAVVAFNTYRTSGNTYLDYDVSDRKVPGGALAQNMVNDQRDSQYGWAKLEGQGALAGWTMQYHHQAWNTKTGHGWIFQIPDQVEQLQEKRQIVSLAYSGKLGADWTQEYMVTHQRHDIFWNLRFFPDNPNNTSLPNGMNEVLDTSARTWFGRAQWSLNLPSESNLLFGAEGSQFLYSGDRSHYSINYDLNNYVPATGNVKAGPWLQYILDKPVLNMGYFAQYSSGKLFGDMFKLVLGARFDKMSFDYYPNLTDPSTTSSKSYTHTSPRAALIVTPTKNLAVKIMYGNAFRAPAPSELAGANTYTLGSNIEGLKPESLTTLEVAVDWIITSNLNWRTNIYRTKFKDQIAYSGSSNLSTNIYTLTTQGLETELLYGFAGWKGFANYSYAKRANEEIIPGNSINPSSDLTWEPAHRLKAGVIFNLGDFSGGVTAVYQGRVERRSSDFAIATYNPYRPNHLGGWVSADAKLTYTISHASSVSVYANNLLDKQFHLVRVNASPFDYQGEGRRIGVVLKTSF